MEGLACADPGARTPNGASGISRKKETSIGSITHSVYSSYKGQSTPLETLQNTIEDTETNIGDFIPPSVLMYGFQPMTSTETVPPSINRAVTNEKMPGQYSDIKSYQNVNYYIPRQKSSRESLVKHLSSFLEPFVSKIRYFIDG